MFWARKVASHWVRISRNPKKPSASTLPPSKSVRSLARPSTTPRHLSWERTWLRRLMTIIGSWSSLGGRPQGRGVEGRRVVFAILLMGAIRIRRRGKRIGRVWGMRAVLRKCWKQPPIPCLWSPYPTIPLHPCKWSRLRQMPWGSLHKMKRFRTAKTKSYRMTLSSPPLERSPQLRCQAIHFIKKDANLISSRHLLTKITSFFTRLISERTTKPTSSSTWRSSPA